MIRSAYAIARRPELWATAWRQARLTAPPGWWRRKPFLPVPSGDYLRFRLLTQYGDASHGWRSDDVVEHLRWCRDWRRGASGPR
ncbi:hypothetical protein [Ilumatobacter sp.]|uniref:hypothetical protein n=1 Tax=Ilumatobacter sp. TaxID=1967498 RepID=UPI003B51767C